MQPYAPQPIDPDLFKRRSQGLAAKSELSNLLRGEQMQEALANKYAQLPEVQGRGFAAAGPNIFNVLAAGLSRGKGSRQMDEIREQAKMLRGDISDAGMAEQQAKEAATMRNYDVQLAQQAATEKRLRDMRQSSTKIDPEGNLRTVFEDKFGNAYADGETIDDYSMWTDPTTIAKMRGGGRTTTFKPTGKQSTDYQETDRFEQVIDDLRSAFAGMSEKAQSELDSPYFEAATDYLPAAMQRLAEDYKYGDEALSYKSMGRGFEADLSKLMAGLQVTGFEMKDRQKWSPFAPGITQKERDSRLDNMEIKLQQKKRRYELLFPEYTFEAVSGRSPRESAPKKQSSVSDLTDLEDIAPIQLSDEELGMSDAELDATIAQMLKSLQEAQ